MNTTTQPRTSYIEISEHGMRTSGVFLYPERIQITVIRVHPDHHETQKPTTH